MNAYHVEIEKMKKNLVCKVDERSEGTIDQGNFIFFYSAAMDGNRDDVQYMYKYLSGETPRSKHTRILLLDMACENAVGLTFTQMIA